MDIKFSTKNGIYSPNFSHATYSLNYPCGTEKTDCYPIEADLPKGVYLLEVWGAAGGIPPQSTNQQSRGGFSKGILKLSKPTKAFFYIGASGTYVAGINSTTSPTFNGGGGGRNGHDGVLASSGGGASDIRLEKDDLYHRLIVAGGGGGVGQVSKCTSGHGGGESGPVITCEQQCTVGISGGQTGDAELFGVGKSIDFWDGCGGGGGWYGGTYGYAFEASGGGGSGFVFTQSTRTIASQSKLQLSSIYILTHASTTSDVENGNLGDGKISITFLPFSCPTFQHHFSLYQLRLLCLLSIFFTESQ